MDNSINEYQDLTLESVVERKSVRLLQARFLESTRQSNEAEVAYRQVAVDEEWIVQEFKKAGSPVKEFSANLISAASCWKKSGNYDRAFELLDEVLQAADVNPRMRNEVLSLRKQWSHDLQPSQSTHPEKKTSPRRLIRRPSNPEIARASWYQPALDYPTEAFNDLLAWLDQERHMAGEKYEAIRRGLIKVFSWRGVSDAEGLADETINRVARNVKNIQSTFSGDPSLYFYYVASRLMMEHERRHLLHGPLEEASDELISRDRLPSERDEALQEDECLQLCLQALKPEKRALLLAYYEKDKQAKIDHRKELARQEGITLNGLRVRIYRMRTELDKCIRQCLKQKATGL